MFGLVYHIRKALREKDRAALSQNLAAYRALATPSALVEHIANSYFEAAPFSTQARGRLTFRR